MRGNGSVTDRDQVVRMLLRAGVVTERHLVLVLGSARVTERGAAEYTERDEQQAGHDDCAGNPVIHGSKQSLHQPWTSTSISARYRKGVRPTVSNS
jgi:hypothetical protein